AARARDFFQVDDSQHPNQAEHDYYCVNEQSDILLVVFDGIIFSVFSWEGKMRYHSPFCQCLKQLQFNSCSNYV
uniref:Uncharacterized protein n=1 Tax=Oryza brachyantha TaxID=4533 RepID=J3LD05_ORYBR